METLVTIIFLIIAALMLFAGVMVVAVKNIIHSALWLIATFFMVGALYLLLEAEFLAIVQVLIYVGAVSVLLLFAIMLTRHVMASPEEAFYRRWPLSLAVCLLLFGAAIVPTLLAQQSLWTASSTRAAQVLGAPERIAGIYSLGVAYVNQYLIPFQIAGVLLLVALVGAIVIAFEEGRRRRVLTLAEEHALRKRQAAEAAPFSEPVLGIEEVGASEP
jgi:NADH-quinone oxidoreductase subunit J